MNEWIKHDGNGMPVDVGTLVDVRCKNGDVIHRSEAGIGISTLPLFWKHGAGSSPYEPYEIVEYRLSRSQSSNTQSEINKPVIGALLLVTGLVAYGLWAWVKRRVS